jgi:hypothetical protein
MPTQAILKKIRAINRADERELWARAGGCCQFQGCNKLVYKSEVTQERVNAAEMAHIYAFSAAGARGNKGLRNKKKLNSVSNLLLVCRGCHKNIDKTGAAAKYSVELLQGWKRTHEDRIRRVVQIDPKKNSHVVIYGGKIGTTQPALDTMLAMSAMFPLWYPADDRAIDLKMECSHEDKTPEFWKTEETHLRKIVNEQVTPRAKEAKPSHFSIFAIADQPLLTLLGTLIPSLIRAVVYQPHRNPDNWEWAPPPPKFKFLVKRPADHQAPPALVFSLSSPVAANRITDALGANASIWELTSSAPGTDSIRASSQLATFRDITRALIDEIYAAHPGLTHLPIFQVMPVSCAVTLGRLHMPKADKPWILYDENNKLGGFVSALEIKPTP